jgi:hypothetical protein
MRRSIALVAAILTVSLGLLASLPAEAGSKHGNKHGFKHGYGHSTKQAYRHGYKRTYGHRRYGHRNYGHRGIDGDTYLAAVGIIAGAEVISAYLQRPPAYQPAPVYAAPVRQPTCYQVV